MLSVAESAPTCIIAHARAATNLPIKTTYCNLIAGRIIQVIASKDHLYIKTIFGCPEGGHIRQVPLYQNVNDVASSKLYVTTYLMQFQLV